MSEIQATVEVQLELGHFWNIDLFQRGYYQVRSIARTNCKVSKVEAKIVSNEPASQQVSENDDAVRCPAGHIEGAICSKTFFIEFRKQRVELNDVIHFTLHLLVATDKLRQLVDSAGLFIDFELWFCEMESGEGQLTSEKQFAMELACKRTIKVNWSCCEGASANLPLMFDYFHLSALSVTVHAFLMALHQPILTLSPKSNKPMEQSSLEAIFFGSLPAQGDRGATARLKHAYAVHHRMASALLAAHESLQKKLLQLTHLLPHPPNLEPINTQEKLHRLESLLAELDCEDDILQMANTQIAQLCGANVVLWMEFLRAVTLVPAVTEYLAEEHQRQVTRRLTQVFFTRQHSKTALQREFGGDVSHFAHAEIVRSSQYMKQLEHSLLQQTDIDAGNDELPVIFEDVFDCTTPEAPENLRPVKSASSLTPAPTPAPPPPLSARLSKEHKFRLNKMGGSRKEKDRQRRKLSDEVADWSGGVELVGMIRPLDPLTPPRHRRGNSLIETTSRPPVSVMRRSHSVRRTTRPDSPCKRTTEDSKGLELRTSSTSAPDSLAEEKRAASLSDLRLSDLESEEQSINRSHSTGDMMLSLDDALREFNLRGGAVPPSEAPVTPCHEMDPGGRLLPAQNTITLDCHVVTGRTLLYLRLPVLEQNGSSPTLSTQPVSERSLLSLQDMLADMEEEVEEEDLPAQVAVNEIVTETVRSCVLSQHEDQLRFHLDLNLRFLSELELPRVRPYMIPGERAAPETHVVVCVHGLEGNAADLRLIKTYVELLCPQQHLSFLMSSVNQPDTFNNIAEQGSKLAQEVIEHLRVTRKVRWISFFGHSLGNVVMRAACASPALLRLKHKFHTFLSLSGPHLGMLYSSSGLVNMGMWLIQKWKKSNALAQLQLKDASDPRKSLLYELAQKPVLEHFRYVILVSSPQDRYVPYHSSRIELCRAATRDTSALGAVYTEMVHKLLRPIMGNPNCTLIRYDCYHSLPSGANNMIGRAAHIAVLDSELFIERLLCRIVTRYLRPPPAPPLEESVLI